MDCRAILLTMISFLVVPFLCSSQQAAGRELYEAAEVGDLERVRALLDQGAKVDHASHNGWTPLIFAAYMGHEGVVRLLIAGGAAVDHVSRLGWTPLSWAACNGHEGVVRLLLVHGACLPGEYKTPERQALITERARAVRAFLEQIERTHGLPRDVTRLIGSFAAQLPKELLPAKY